MRQFIKRSLIQSLGVGKVFPTGMTAPDDLHGLIRTLHPRICHKGLIRLGPRGDGGYLVPNDLEGIQACYSPGVNNESGFEKDCAELGMQVFLADKSVEGPSLSHKAFSFTKKYIGVLSNDDFMTLDDWVDSTLADKRSDLLLQIDIEGYEYEVFLAASRALMRRFRIIVAEFHNLDELWNRPYFNLAGRAFQKILETHACVHIHPNNYLGSSEKEGLEIPELMEFTFLRRDRIEGAGIQQVFPHPLDCDNTDKPTLALPRCWYQG